MDLLSEHILKKFKPKSKSVEKKDFRRTFDEGDNSSESDIECSSSGFEEDK